MEVNSQRRKILLFLSTNIAFMTSHANHQLKGAKHRRRGSSRAKRARLTCSRLEVRAHPLTDQHKNTTVLLSIMELLIPLFFNPVLNTNTGVLSNLQQSIKFTSIFCSVDHNCCCLRTVPAFVIAHTFCASRDTQVSYGWCLLLQGYFCAI